MDNVVICVLFHGLVMTLNLCQYSALCSDEIPFLPTAERPNAQSSNNLSGKLEPKYENPTNGSSSGSQVSVCGRQT